MNRKKKILLIFLGIAVLVGAAAADLTAGFGTVSGILERNQAGEGDREEDFLLEADSLEGEKEYEVTIPEQVLSESEEAEALTKARQEIDDTVFADYEQDKVTGDLQIQDQYADGFVDVDWSFSSEGGYFYRDDGKLYGKAEIPEAGVLILARACMTCQDREEEYDFSFMLYPCEKNEEELLLEKIGAMIQESVDRNQTFIQLPEQVDDQKIRWKKNSSFYFLKLLCLEGAVALLLYLSELENRKIREKRRREELEMDLPGILQKLALLIGSGMSIRQAWFSIAERYEEERKTGKVTGKAAYDGMVKAMHQIREGLSESLVYRNFGQFCGVPSYYRLVGLLVQGLEKGNREICSALEREAEESFEKRRILVTRKGEEAGTKMLFPLLGMMAIVIAIVMVPAFMSFQF